jgi:hypothetical protein
MGCWTGILQVFPISMYNKITLLVSEKTKKSFAFGGILVFLHGILYS